MTSTTSRFAYHGGTEAVIAPEEIRMSEQAFQPLLYAISADVVKRLVAGVTDLEPCHGDVIAALLERDGRHLSDITQATHRTKPTLTVLVNHLEANGYVRRKPSKTDARVAEIWLTAKCRRLIPLFLDISARMAAEITRTDHVALML